MEATNLLYEVFVEVTSGRDEEAKNLEVAAKQGLKLLGRVCKSRVMDNAPTWR